MSQVQEASEVLELFRNAHSLLTDRMNQQNPQSPSFDVNCDQMETKICLLSQEEKQEIFRIIRLIQQVGRKFKVNMEPIDMWRLR